MIGPVIVGGNAINTSGVGGASVAVDGKLPQIPHNAPSYVKGTASSVFKDIAASNYAELILYLGTVNKDSFSSVQTGLKNIIFTDEYVDFEAARASFISEAGSVKSDVTLTDADKQYGRVTVDAGSVYEIDNFDGVNELDIRGNVSDGNDTIIIVKASGNVQLPLPLIDGEETPNTEDGPQMGITWILLNADSVNLVGNGHNHVGHVIAPNADVKKLGGGNYNGCIIANSFETGAEGHMWPYNGKTFTPAASGFKVQKQLLDTEGNVAAWPEGQTFTFILKGLDGAPMPADANGAVKSVVVKSTGIAGFGDITFPCDEDSQATEYHYELKEVKGSQEKITYDETVYHITVKVSYQETSGNKKAVIESVTYTTDDSQDVKPVGESFVYSFTNVYDNIEKIDIPVSKIWVDENDQDGLRPESVKTELYADGQTTGNVLTLNKGNNWSGRWTDLPKTKNGQEIVYTVKEAEVAGYTSSVKGDAANGFTITNTHKPEVTSIEGSKVWKDKENQDGKRPDSITVNPYADGELKETKTISGKDGWQWTFTGLDKYKNGQEISYTVDEKTDGLGEYKKEGITGKGTLDDPYVITNSHTPELTEISGTKIWKDHDNWGGMRPESITVNLFADNEKVGSQVVKAEQADESGKWTFRFKDLPKYKNGKEITYTINEEPVEWYTTEVNGTTITNSYTPKTTGFTVKKVWADGDNQDAIRPLSISVQLYRDNNPYGDKVILNEKNGWSYTWTGLLESYAGRVYYYEARETGQIRGYQTTAKTEGYETVITNTHTPEVTSVKGSKVWADDDNRDGKRPESITIRLYADGKEVDHATVSKDNWSFSFTGLPKYKNINNEQVEISYTVTEDKVDGYVTAITGEGTFVVTNTHKSEMTEISGTKTWNDQNDQDGKRPSAITVKLMKNGSEYRKQEVTAKDNWKYTFKDLPVYENGQKITYTVAEVVSEDYTSKANGYDLKNSYTPEKTSYSVVKLWDDENDQDGLRPSSVKVQLYADGRPSGNEVELNAANGFAYTWTGLDLKSAGNEIHYTVREITDTDGYTVSYGEDKETHRTTITNSHTPATVDIPVTKIWSDADDQDGRRPGEITVSLLANGKVVRTQKLSAGQADKEGSWTYTFTGLPEKENGQKIIYTVTEEKVTGYETAVTTEGENGFTITNSHTPETTEVNGAKTWNDNEDKENARPDSITVRVFDGDQEVASRTVTEADNWTWSFTGLPKYRNGKEISYTVAEDHMPDYTAKVNGSNIINTYTPDETAITVVKVWDDAEDQDCKRPDSITVVLHEKWGGIFDRERERATLSEVNNWTVTFENLPVNKKNEKVNYWIEELTKVPGYDTTINNPDKEHNQTTITITNSYTPETVTVEGSKKWKDYDDQEGKRPDSIQVILYQNGKETEKTLTVTPDDKGNWNYSFTDLPRYRNENGKRVENVYTVKELTKLADYEKPATGNEENNYVITNQIKMVTVSYSVEKSWNDDNNRDGLRKSITVQLLADGKPVDGKTATLTAENNWTCTWNNLPKYNAGDAKIVYTAVETDVPAGYGNEPGYVYKDDRTVITNSHTPELISVSGEKEWKDADDQDGIRPSEITVELYGTDKNTPVRTVKVSADAEGKWSYRFTDLPKYENGEMISYTVSETGVPEGYVSAVKGTGTAEDPFVITNTHTPETTSVSGRKTWVDGNNEEGKRPSEITVNLYRNAEKKPIASKKVKAAEDGTWSYSFEDLPKYENGQEISYRVSEEAVKDYSASYNGNDIVNTYTPDQTQITVTKIWNDENDQDGKRPESIEVQLYAGRSKQGETVILSESNQWTYTWKNLDSTNALGFRIHYTVKEVSDRGEYKTTITGDTNVIITNSYTPEVTSVKVDKQWSDYENQENKRPDSIQVSLLADENVTETITLKADNDGNWSHTFENLPKYRNDGNGAQEIQYTVKEAAMADYTSTVEKTGDNTFVITNTMDPVFTEYEVTKFWDDENDQDGLRKEIRVDLLADGKVAEGKTITLGTTQGETYRWTGLPKYNEEGTRILYTAREAEVPIGYDENPGYVDTDGRTEITNSHTPETVAVEGSKIWEDNDNAEEARPESIVVNLLADGVAVPEKDGGRQEVKPDADGNWSYSFTDLPKFKNGQEIRYTVSEEAVTDYSASYEEGKIINTYTPDYTSITVTKIWDDNNDQDGLRPESIEVQLYAGLFARGEAVTLSEENNWTYTWTELPDSRFGTKINYTVKEVGTVEGYTTTQDGEKNATNIEIVNTHTPEETTRTVVKVWDDAGNRDHMRPESITVQLYADDEACGDSILLHEGNGWTYTWEHLPVKNAGKDVVYRVAEISIVNGYTTSYSEDSFVITNRRNTEPAPTPGSNDPTPDPTTEVTPGTTPPDEEVLGAKRVSDNAVLGARRGSDLAVLGKRRRPQTGDDLSLILWLIALGASVSTAGISIAMQYRKSTKKDKK